MFLRTANVNNKLNHAKTAFVPDSKKSIFVPLYFNEMIKQTKKLAFLVILLAFSAAAFAQGTATTPERKKGRPNIPGTFQIDFGYNLPTEKGDFNISPLRSTTVNFYYYHDMRIGKSKFSFHPGVGVGLDRYGFNNGKTLAYATGGNNVEMVAVNATTYPGLKKSKLITNYIDIPVELRFSTNPEDPNRSFKVSLGFKVGVLYNSFTKIKYAQDSENKKLKNYQDFNLNPFRYGALLRVGAGNISAFGYYNLSPLFKSGKGPALTEDINNITVGISLSAF